MENSTKLNFGLGNEKLAKSIATFSLPAGHVCCFAKDCLAMADRETGKVTDGKDTEFRCFAATQESRLPSLRKSRWDNFEMLQAAGTIEAMGDLIQDSLPKGILIVRVHVSGDFFSERYFLAWLNVALNNPAIVFYGYTKSTPFLVKYAKDIPSNFRFTASFGGTRDNLINLHNLKSVKVVFSVEESLKQGLEIDHDDSHAFAGKESFSLLIHSTQPANSMASKAMSELKRQGVVVGYGKTSNAKKVVDKKKLIMYVNVKSNNQIFVATKKIKTFKPSLINALTFSYSK